MQWPGLSAGPFAFMGGGELITSPVEVSKGTSREAKLSQHARFDFPFILGERTGGRFDNLPAVPVKSLDI